MYTLEDLVEEPKDVRIKHLNYYIDDWQGVLEFVNTASTIEEAKNFLYLCAYDYGGEHLLVAHPDDF